jgi:hypothetical protein
MAEDKKSDLQRLLDKAIPSNKQTNLMREAIFETAIAYKGFKAPPEGSGSCTDLINEALKNAGAKRDFNVDAGPTGDYVWGNQINFDNIMPGDILQFKDYHMVPTIRMIFNVIIPNDSCNMPGQLCWKHPQTCKYPGKSCPIHVHYCLTNLPFWFELSHDFKRRHHSAIVFSGLSQGTFKIFEQNYPSGSPVTLATLYGSNKLPTMLSSREMEIKVTSNWKEDLKQKSVDEYIEYLKKTGLYDSKVDANKILNGLTIADKDELFKCFPQKRLKMSVREEFRVEITPGRIKAYSPIPDDKG